MSQRNEALLKAVRARGRKSEPFGRGIATADAYVRTMADAIGWDSCWRHFSRRDTQESWNDVVLKASRTLVYGNDEMVRLADDGDLSGIETPKNTLMVFTHVLTSSRKDRDGDVLHSEGATVDPKMPLLWQHVHTSPIGKFLAVREQNAKRLKVASCIVDINELCHDSAVMIDNGIGRFSHGFRAMQFDKIKEGVGDGGGFDVTEFEIMEESLVSVPANPDAEVDEVLLSLVEGAKLKSPILKDIGRAIRQRRPVQVGGVTLKVVERVGDVETVRELTAGSADELKRAAGLIGKGIDDGREPGDEAGRAAGEAGSPGEADDAPAGEKAGRGEAAGADDAEVTEKTWSDAARQAAAAARRAHASASQTDTGATSGQHSLAMDRSRSARDASRAAAEASRSGNHDAAAAAHRHAMEAHEDASNQHLRAGNHEASEAHYEASNRHFDAMLSHEEQIADDRARGRRGGEGKGADPVAKAVEAHETTVPAAKPVECLACGETGLPTADGKCPACGADVAREPAGEPVEVVNARAALGLRSKGDPIRWNKSLSSTFDVASESLKPSTTLFDWASKYTGTPVKRLALLETSVPSARMGSFLTGLRECLRGWERDDLRNMDGSHESPPRFEKIQLNSARSDTFLVCGTEFLRGPERKMVVSFEPRYYGLSVQLCCPAADQAEAQSVIDKAWEWARENNFMRGEAFALSGEFLPRTSDAFGDVFLAPKNAEALRKTVERLNRQGKEFQNRGTMMMGPPGTGKTLTGRVLRNEAEATFIWVSARDFHCAGSVGGMSLAFEMAKELAPSVIFFEDVDNWLDERSVDFLKSEMDGIGRSSGVWTLLTTNFPEKMPEALIDRPGRFHDVLKVDLPDADARRKMLGRWLPGLSGKDAEATVAATDGYSGAHVYELCWFAKTLAAEEEQPVESAVKAALQKIKDQRELIVQTQLAGSNYRPRPFLTRAAGPGGTKAAGAGRSAGVAEKAWSDAAREAAAAARRAHASNPHEASSTASGRAEQSSERVRQSVRAEANPDTVRRNHATAADHHFAAQDAHRAAADAADDAGDREGARRHVVAANRHEQAGWMHYHYATAGKVSDEGKSARPTVAEAMAVVLADATPGERGRLAKALEALDGAERSAEAGDEWRRAVGIVGPEAEKTWSDAARQAAAAARRLSSHAQQITLRHSRDHLAEQNEYAASAADSAARAVSAHESGNDEFWRVMGSRQNYARINHESAAERHEDAARVHERLGQSEAAQAHREASQAHRRAVELSKDSDVKPSGKSALPPVDDAGPELYGGAGLHGEVHKGCRMLPGKEVAAYLVEKGLEAADGGEAADAPGVDGAGLKACLSKAGWRHKWFTEEEGGEQKSAGAVEKTWSDAARQAAAAARRARGISTISEAHEASDRANAASQHARASRSSESHEDAAMAHTEAAAVHNRARARATSNVAVPADDPVGQAHSRAAQAHLEAANGHFAERNRLQAAGKSSDGGQKTLTTKRIDAYLGDDGLKATAAHVVGRKGVRVWMSREESRDELGNKTWSDAARQAAAAARRASAVVRNDSSGPWRLSVDARIASETAAGASRQLESNPTSEGHRQAANAHLEASHAHRDAAEDHRRAGNDDAVEFHEAAAAAHRRAVNAHHAMIHDRGGPKE